jgi:integrase
MLTAKQVQNAKRGRHLDAKGLYLEVSPTGSKRWLLRYSRRGGRGVTEAALGSVEFVSLAQAREKAFDFRRRLASGLAPIAPRRTSFGQVALDVAAMKAATLKQPAPTYNQLRYTSPLTDRDVASITVDDVLSILQPIWTTKPAVAERVRSLMEATLDAAKIRGLRTAENPARWRGTLALVLPRRVTLSRGHFAALPYDQIKGLMTALDQDLGVVSRAFRFTVLCALRKGETMGLRWSDISTDCATGPVAIIPPDKTKQAREHRVPLSSGALAVIEEQRTFRDDGDEYVFPSLIKRGQPLNPCAFNNMLKRLGFEGTPHGVARSSFRDWIADCTEFPRDLAEMCLGHVVSGVEGVYRRSDMLERRRAIMQAWSDFIVESH